MRLRIFVVLVTLVATFGRLEAEPVDQGEEGAAPAQSGEQQQDAAAPVPAPGADPQVAPDTNAKSEGDPEPEQAVEPEHAAIKHHDDAEPDGKFDLDGDGTDDKVLEAEYDAAMQGMPTDIDPEAVDKELDARPEDAELKPSITVARFRQIVRVVKKVVLARMEKKMAASADTKLARFSAGILVFSLFGLLLLAMPLVLRRKYPGQGKVVLKFSALAALTFILTVNLFGAVLMGMKEAQGALGSFTNPSLAIARGTFDTLDERADDYIVMGKELFVPTLRQLQGNSDAQPSVLLIENGKKIVQKAGVFISVAKAFKKLDFVFGILPIVLFAISMVLFGLAIRPTLQEVIALPARAAAGEAGVGRDITKRAVGRVWGELRAALCTLAVLSVLTLVSGLVLGRIVGPAIDALLSYFSLAVSYLQFVDTANATLVFIALFGVIMFLVLNLATLILATTFFLGKCQKIFQQRFNDGVPVREHKRYFKWGVPAVVFVQVFPLLFIVVAQKALDRINSSITSGVTDADQVAWSKLLVTGPLFLVLGYVLLFWAARGIKAIRFLQSYKVVRGLRREDMAPTISRRASI